MAVAAAGAALWLAGLLVWRLAPALDAALLGTFYATRDGVAARIARFVTVFGDYGLLVTPNLVGVALLAVRGDRRTAVWLAAATLGGRGLTELQKWIFDRRRPPEVDRLIEVHTASFPSAHAFNSMLVALALVLAFRGGRGMVAAAIAFSLAVGFSRMMLGVHWPSDVVAGWGSAIFWLMATRALAQPPAARAETRSG